MGLDLRADGYPKEGLHIGYIGFGVIRRQIAKSYNERLGEIYEKPYKNWDFSYSQEEIEEYNSLCDDDLDILLNHSDCEGRMKYHECRKVIRALDRIEFKYPDDWRQDWKEKYYILKDMIRYCAKNRKRLYFG